MKRNIGILVMGMAASQLSLAADAPVEEALRARWTAAYNSGDAEALGAMYSHDARLQQGYCPAVIGRDAIESFWRSDLGDGTTTTQLEIEDTFSAADLVYVSGTYAVLIAQPGSGPQRISGTYSQIWRRAGAGDWTVHRETWTNLACVQGASAPSEQPDAPITPAAATSV